MCSKNCRNIFIIFSNNAIKSFNETFFFDDVKELDRNLVCVNVKLAFKDRSSSTRFELFRTRYCHSRSTYLLRYLQKTKINCDSTNLL